MDKVLCQYSCKAGIMLKWNMPKWDFPISVVQFKT